MPLVSPSTTGGWRCDLRVIVLAAKNTDAVNLTIATGWGDTHTKVYPLSQTAGEPHTINVSLEVSRNAVDLWWPRGMGAQTLYYINVTVGPVVTNATAATASPPPAAAASSFSATISKRIGFRKVELTTGAKFHLSVNDVAFFALGANVIPLSSFPPEFSVEQIGHLLDAAADQHMNIVRIWGGGGYLTDAFYDTTDRLGLLVWHDLMCVDRVEDTITPCEFTATNFCICIDLRLDFMF